MMQNSDDAGLMDDKFSGMAIDLPGLGRQQLTTLFKKTSETALYFVTYPGILIKIFDLASGKPDELSYGPYMRFTLELANFEDIINIEKLQRFVPLYYGANINFEKQYAFIAMEHLDGVDFQSWSEAGPAESDPEDWVNEFKQAIYEALFIMTQFHRHGIILVDFKPENILRVGNRGTKFVDLGAFLTPRHNKGIEKYLYTATPDYSELLIDASNIQSGIAPNEASDIFSAGVAFFEMAAGSSRLEIDEATADEILGSPAIFRFRDSQIRDMWKEYPHLRPLLPLVETQLKERRILFSEIWHLLKGYLATKVPDWEGMTDEQHGEILLATGATFIREQLPEPMQWLAEPVARSTILRSTRLKSVAELMQLIESPLPALAREDLLRNSTLLQFLRDVDRPLRFVEHLNTWEARLNVQAGRWCIGAPAAYVQLGENALFTFLKETGRNEKGDRYFEIVSDLEADDFGTGKLTVGNLLDDHKAWVA